MCDIDRYLSRSYKNSKQILHTRRLKGVVGGEEPSLLLSYVSYFRSNSVVCFFVCIPLCFFVT